MASAIHQLIAQQQGPNILGSALQGLAAASQEKQQAQENELNKQRITLGQRQLANADRQIAEQHQEKSEKFAANIAYQIRNEKDPMRKAELFNAGRQAAADSGLDTSKWPQQYNDQTQAGLDVIFNKVYGGEILKADLNRKPTGPTSGVGKLMADKAAAIARGATAEEIAAYDKAINNVGKGQNISLTVNGDKQEPTKSVQTTLQENILKGEQELSNLASIAKTYKSDYLTYEGRAKAKVGEFLDKAGQSDSKYSQFNAGRTTFKNNLNQFFNQYKKDITGAAAGEKEMEDLKNSIINEDQGPLAFDAALSQFMAKAKRNMELNKRSARGGIDVAPTKNAKGWTLHIDANGNQAYVSPDGKDYEEVQ